MNNRLPWAEQIPWFALNLYWFNGIKNWQESAGRICDHCITGLGMSWPLLQERLLASSEYLEANQGKYKPAGARQFYANQVAGYRNIVKPDPRPRHRADNGSQGLVPLSEVISGWTAADMAAAKRLGPRKDGV